MARTTAAPSLPSSASIPSLPSSASSNSLSARASVTRLRSNSNLSGRLPASPSAARVPPGTHSSAGQHAPGQPTTPTTSLHPISPNTLVNVNSISPSVDRSGVITPPPRPPRGPLRSPGAPRSPSMPSISTELSSSLRFCQRALEHSKDQGDTLDVSRDKKLDRIDADMVDFFRTRTGRDRRGVWRLALSYNSLRDGSIVSSFSKLNRLRYLNLKGNKLTVVPPPLLELASLEILDLSKNHIVALPEKPGRLAHLKVLSLSHNLLTSLPIYLAEFRNLKVFKVDHNPIQWPPRDVLGPLIDFDPPPEGEARESKPSQTSRSEENLKPWIEGMRRWLCAEVAKQAEAGAKAPEAETQIHIQQASVREIEESQEGAEVEPVAAVDEVTPANGGSFLTAADTRPTVCAEPASYAPPLASEASASSSQVTMKRAPATGLSSEEDRAAPLSSPEAPIGQRQQGAGSSDSLTIPTAASSLSLPSHALQHDRSVSSSSATPPVSASTSSSASGQSALPRLPPAIPTVANGHTRGASYTATQRMSGTLTAKKSLPDLRQSHAKIIEERRGEATDELRPLGLGIGPQRTVNWPKLQRPFEETKPRLQNKGSMDVLRRQPVLGDMDVGRRDSQDGPTIDESRNSYFRRLSMLPPSTISKQVSPAMLVFIDSIRGILFALTQLHSALRQYLNFAVPDRVAGVFARVLEPAGGYLAHLINALDRFDSMSRRSAPPPSAVRGVVESAKESITVFGKVVAVLRLQTPAFRDADVRYTRSLLLSIYGAMSEIAHAWRSMLPLLAEIRPILFPDSLSLRLAPPMSQSNSLTGRTLISPILERGESLERTTPARNASLAPSQMPPVGTSPRSKSRRHAGSFSAQDVEKGMLMGSPVSRLEWDMSRTIFERPEEGPFPIPPFPLHAEPEPPTEVAPLAFPRGGHVPTSSAGSSYLSAPNGSSRNLSFDVRPPTPASATLFDEDLLDQVELATDIAFQVWLKLAEDIGASAPYPPSHAKADSVGSMNSARLALNLNDGRRPPTIPSRQYAELVAALGTAEQVTASLRETLMGLRANPFAPTQWPLHDNAQQFIKTVVKVMELIKVVMLRHSFSTNVRQLLSKLTQLTRECAILIQVSSHRPGTSTPASGPTHTPGGHSVHGHGGMGGHGIPGIGGMSGHSGGRHTPAHSGGHSGGHSQLAQLQGPRDPLGLGSLDRSLERGLDRVGLGSLAPSIDYSAHSSSEDLTAPASASSGGLRGLHLPARHGLRNASVGRINGAPTNANSNGSSHSPPINDFGRMRVAEPRGVGYY